MDYTGRVSSSHLLLRVPLQQCYFSPWCHRSTRLVHCSQSSPILVLALPLYFSTPSFPSSFAATHLYKQWPPNPMGTRETMSNLIAMRQSQKMTTESLRALRTLCYNLRCPAGCLQYQQRTHPPLLHYNYRLGSRHTA